MKKNIIWLALALMTVVFASCSNEDEAFDGSTPNKKGQITFALPMSKGGTTYVVGNADENKLDLTSLQIIMVDDATAKVEQVFSGSEIATQAVGNSKSATISIPDGTVGNKTFYFVGNPETVSDMSVAVGTTLADLQAMATDKLAAPARLSAANGLLLTASTAISNVEGATTGTVTLKRRVARFDIENVATTTNVTIKSIKLSDARLSAYVFAGNTPDIHSGYALANLTDIDYTLLANANTGTDESVFYLYPGKVGEVGHSHIQIIAEVQNTEKIFNVKATTIEANKRYTLKVLDANSNDFVLDVAEWDEGGDIDANLSNTLPAGSYTKVSGNGSFDGARWFGIDNDNTANEFKFTVYAQSKAGVLPSVHNVVGTFAKNIKAVAGTPGALTYAGVKGYPVEITVTVDGYGAAEEMASRVIITDLSGSKATFETRVYFADAASDFYPGTNLKPVVWGGVTFAPVNVGASNLEDLGFFFQWGRNLGFSSAMDPEIINGPLSASDAANTDKFIVAGPNDWLDIQDDNLWNGANKQGPCPAGWYVPSHTQYTVIFTAVPTVVNDTYIYTADNGVDELHFPIAGMITSTGVLANRAAQTYYWATGPVGDKMHAIFGYAPSPLGVTPSLYRALGASVRCIKN